MAHEPKIQQPGVMGWLEYRLPIFGVLNEGLVTYPAPRNLNYFWNFGSIAGIMLVSQILTGLFLAMHYAANSGLAFDSVEHIMRDVNYGWLLRYLHAVGASMFFIVVYIHTFRGLYYGSYKSPREVLWGLGVVILLLMMATAFMGYVLPWGQMSFWGATVITNLFSAFPIVGEPIVTWLWGGFAVDDPTLNRFYALHFVLPFVIVGVVGLHLIALHAHGSNNPTGIDAKGPQDKIPFHPYYTVKDFFGFGVFFLVYAAFVFFAPNYLGHSDNYIPADAMVTPMHIVPEWYFLPYYAILRAFVFDTPLWLPGILLVGVALALRFVTITRVSVRGLPLIGKPIAAILPENRLSDFWTGAILLVGFGCIFAGLLGAAIPSKLAGVCAMFGSILVLFFAPWLDTSPVRSCDYRPVMKWFFWLFVANGILLGWLGSQPPEGILPYIALAGAAYYYAFFLLIMPICGRLEKTRPLPASIGTPVLGH
ncbi:MAG: cytochrome b N-terminal domain-containing protein [Alphaproteobacteria bacterium]